MGKDETVPKRRLKTKCSDKVFPWVKKKDEESTPWQEANDYEEEADLALETCNVCNSIVTRCEDISKKNFNGRVYMIK